MKKRVASALVTIAWVSSASGGVAGTCPNIGDEIATDRPDITNSSIVVPAGSLQSENGVNFTAHHGDRILDAPNSRLRLGIAPCLEVLIDLPTYFATVRGQANSGFTNVAPAFKWQVSPLPGEFDLSATFGAGLPTGTTRITGGGVQPYLQFPWSQKLADGWGLSGMATLFFRPSNSTSQLSTQHTFAIERKVAGRADVFVEYVGDFFDHGGSSQIFNAGGAYRLTPTQQIDFHVGFGLNRNAPSYFFGLGYSFRRDGLFHPWP